MTKNTKQKQIINIEFIKYLIVGRYKKIYYIVLCIQHLKFIGNN